MKLGSKIKLKEILDWTNSTVYGCKNNSLQNFKLASISTDTRTIEEEDFFIPVAGENYNGHDFIGDALNKGASGFIFESRFHDMVSCWKSKTKSDIWNNMLVLETENNLNFLQDISYHYIRKFNPIVIGITGSVGKTTTKDFVAGVLSRVFNTKFTPKNFNTEIGISKSVLEIDKKTQFFIAELGMRANGQIGKLSKVINLDIGAITAIGPSHLEFFKNIEEIALAKSEMAEFIAIKKGVLFLNNDDDWTDFIEKRAKCKVLKFGRNNNLDFNFLEKDMDEYGKFSFDFYKNKKKLTEINLHVSGYHNLYNACCAAAICNFLKLEPEVIREGIESTVLENKRMEVIIKGDKIIINDCYNASPLSMKKAIDTLKLVASKNKGRSVVILADMLELGDESERLHFEIGQYLKERDIDVVIAAGRLSEKICLGFLPGKSHYFTDKGNLGGKLKSFLKAGDVILIKGSRTNRLESLLDFIN
ncbi:MAG: UDP-N-acetylmuramoyl-tripeptide--D-alanyl-D-alanine ligase [Actinobacteria bacterium]|nr:UDP-N-acetylmuramoyl-tripeptide--D-alanyl-D-alanine ligase [Actinomycetota bacterium]